MSSGMLVLWLVIAIAIILVLILKFKMNAGLALFIASMAMGIACGVGTMGSVSTITSGFGSTMTGIGVSIGFGIMLGQLVADAGAVQTISNGLLKLLGVKRGEIALGLAGFIVSIPVFFDVGFVVMCPLGKQMAKTEGAKPLPYYLAALDLGLGIAHTFVPPTPGPLTGGELMGVDVGTTILFGIIVGLPTFFLNTLVFQNVFLKRKGFWNPEKDELHDPEQERIAEEKAKALMRDESKIPGMAASLFPIFLPIVMILIGSVAGVAMETVPEWLKMIADKNFAMACGVIAAMIVCGTHGMSFEDMDKSINACMGSVGTVLLITGLGGSFGAILTKVGIGAALQGVLGTLHMPSILFVWIVGSVLKFAQGSGTVAMITALSIAASMNITDTPAILITLAGFSGSMLGCHINDSGYWIFTNISGLSVKGGLKIYFTTGAITAVISLILIFILSIFIH